MPEDSKKSIKEAVAEFFAELFGKKADAPTFDEAAVSRIVSQAVKAATDPLVEQNKTLTTKFTELQATLQTSAADSKRATAKAFVEKMKAAGKWIPAFDVAGIPVLLEQMAVSGGTVKFGEAGKEKEYASYEALTQFIEQLPKIIPTGDLTGKKKDSKGNVIAFNEARGIDVDMQSVALNARALEIQKERKIEFGEALSIATQELSA